MFMLGHDFILCMENEINEGVLAGSLRLEDDNDEFMNRWEISENVGPASA